MEQDESITLLEAVGPYAGSLKANDNLAEVQRELSRFVQWCGRGRTFSDIHPPEIGKYADQIAGTGTAPQAAQRLRIVKNFLAYAKKKGFVDKNLAQHLRIRKARTRSNAASLQGTKEVVELTADGHTQLVAQLEKLKATRVPIAQQIRRAAADKDVRENAPLEAAREQLGHVESRIRSIENTLAAAVIIDSSKGKLAAKMQLGTSVLVKDMKNGRETRYMLVGRSEANPLDGKISDASPLGKALFGRSTGQEIEVEAPRGKTRYRIVKVYS